MTRFSSNPRPDDPPRPEADPLETSELAQRLRRMEWPTAPAEVKQRCLEKVLERVRESGSLSTSPPDPNPAE